MAEVMSFIQDMARILDTYVELIWDRFVPDSSVPVKYILVAAQKDKATELRNIDSFRDRFMGEFKIEIRVKQGLIFVPDIDCLTCLIRGIRFYGEWCEVYSGWAVCDSYSVLITYFFFVHVDILSTPENAKRAAEQKKLEDLLRALGGNRLSLCDPCMEGTRLDILQQIETGIKSTDGDNVIWIRGSPGVGKSALATSITTRLQD